MCCCDPRKRCSVCGSSECGAILEERLAKLMLENQQSKTGEINDLIRLKNINDNIRKRDEDKWKLNYIPN